MKALGISGIVVKCTIIVRVCLFLSSLSIPEVTKSKRKASFLGTLREYGTAATSYTLM